MFVPNEDIERKPRWRAFLDFIWTDLHPIDAYLTGINIGLLPASLINGFFLHNKDLCFAFNLTILFIMGFCLGYLIQMEKSHKQFMEFAQQVSDIFREAKVDLLLQQRGGKEALQQHLKHLYEKD